MIKAFQGINFPFSNVCTASFLYKAAFQDYIPTVSCTFLQIAFIALWKTDFAGMFGLVDKLGPIN